jgi:transcriptional regulator GlxA family with amidase domain
MRGVTLPFPPDVEAGEIGRPGVRPGHGSGTAVVAVVRDGHTRPVLPAPARDALVVAVLVFDGVRLLDVTGPLEVFDVATAIGVPYDVIVCSPDGQDVTTSSGLRLGVQRRADQVAGVDTLVVPGGECLVEKAPPAALLTAITTLARTARRTTSVCAGSFALAAAGLLEGRRATTHWKHIATLARRFPELTVDEVSLYVRDGDVLTSAGVSAGIDLALALVEEGRGGRDGARGRA